MENQQVGWSTEAKLLHRISKELERLQKAVIAAKPALTAAEKQAIIDDVITAVADDSAATNPTVAELTAAMLNSGYPTANIGFRVICMSISTGALIYIKTASGWAKQSVTNVT
jgi:hypothetical protein